MVGSGLPKDEHVSRPAAPVAPGPLREAGMLVGNHLKFAMLFSALVNVAYLAPMFYMLQVYDRVLPASSKSDLFLLTVALALSLLVLTLLDRVRSRILFSASMKLDQAFCAR